MLPQLTHKTDPKGFSYFEQLLAPANITLNGANSSDIKVSNERLFRRVLRDGTLGLGEAYMDGWWDCEQLDELVCRTLRSGLHHSIRNNWRFVVFSIFCRLFNLQSVQRAFMVGEKHYDIGNDVFEAMLDTHMNYSCGYWASARNLGEAQEHKMEMICRKLQLEPGMRVLDVGCGWGGLSWWMAERHGVEVTGITVSKEQAELAQNRCRDLPVTIELIDYRSLSGCYDRIVSVGMFEHVGQMNYRTYFRVLRSLLAEGGIFLLHTIGAGDSHYAYDRWTQKYIFPNSVLPLPRGIVNNCDGLFIIEDWHNIGADYDPTLMAWYRNFNDAWPELKSRYSDRFKRMFDYYLLTSAGSFRARDNQLWQVVLSAGGIEGGYLADRWLTAGLNP
jgi:cyclopropane-fatty-acyl-phospholipid synthase